MTAERDEHGRLKKGSVINPSGKGGFQDHPEKRSNGRWDKRTSADYLYNKITRMTLPEIEQYKRDHDPLTVNEFKAINIALASAQPPSKSKDALKAAQYIDERTQGKPIQKTEQNITQVDPPTFQIEFIDTDKEDKNDAED